MRWSRFSAWRLPALLLVVAAAVLAAGAGQAQAHWCYETVNPAGKPAVGDNGFPTGPFGGDAVPGGKHTSPGTNGNGPINSDGFYVVNGNLFLSPDGVNFTALLDPDTLGNPLFLGAWPAGTTIKFTQWSANKGVKISPMAGPHSVIQYQVQAGSDLYVLDDATGGYTFCGVPPPTF